MGVPLGPVRRPAPFAPADAREAIEGLEERVAEFRDAEREALLAWLSAFRSHWPSSWAAAIGAPGERLIGALSRLPFDTNRYLKLRRIAIDNLSRSI